MCRCEWAGSCLRSAAMPAKGASPMDRTPLQTLRDYGQSAWLGEVSSEVARNGELERWVADHGIRGFAFRPDGDLRDIQRACDALLDVWGQSAGRDGHVSAPLLGALGTAFHETRNEAALLAATVDRPNFLVAMPAGPLGIRVLEDSIAAGISVDATALFSLAQHAEAARAYLRGLRRLLRNGGDPAIVASVASFPVARLDSEIDRRFLAPGRAATAFHGTLAIAIARLAYDQYRKIFSGHQW